MTRDELLHLIAQSTGPRLDFKRSLVELEDGVRTIVAFTNADGCRGHWCVGGCRLGHPSVFDFRWLVTRLATPRPWTASGTDSG
jgi:hypothetical protein